ncbi:hypothetical protein ABI59_21825 [Acidobacteria bacterium Mor1]|nr:hypothetical protein ABI59_21825 [Acidobacteria bacterium Mor1]
MKRTRFTLWLALIACALITSMPAAAPQEEPVSEETNIGFYESTSPRLDPAIGDKQFEKIDPSFRHEFADHVANGVQLRNRTSATIHSRGVPAGSRVLQGLLYWNFSDNNPEGPDTSPILFRGNVVVGRKTADSQDPCWGMAGSHSYVADVTPWILNNGSHPNQDYDVVVPFNARTSTTGQNPWNPSEVQEQRNQGATLIIIYANDQTVGPLFVYDNLPNSMFFNTATFNLAHGIASRPALFSMVGADGQRGGGFDNSAALETSFFDGVQIAGSPVMDSDWNGGDGVTLTQLWDTHSHLVNLNNSGTSSVTYNSTGDCLVPVAFVIDTN